MAELGTAWRVMLWAAEGEKMAPPGVTGAGGEGDFEGQFSGWRGVGSADCCIVEYGPNYLSKPFATFTFAVLQSITVDIQHIKRGWLYVTGCKNNT